MKYKIIIILSLFLAVLHLNLKAEEYPLSEKAEVSLLTCDPGAEVWSCFGHTGLRICDTIREIDLVFNYGTFDFNADNFLYRFCKGETDYVLSTSRYTDFLLEYQMRNSSVTEQKIDLYPSEVAQLWKALVVNLQPENRTYRYNYYYDNCSTRPRDMIAEQVSKGIIYPLWVDSLAPITFRDIIYESTAFDRWYTFGIDLLIGADSDQPTSGRQRMFRPDFLEQAFAQANRYTLSGDSIIPLVKSTERVVISETIGIPPSSFKWTPDIVMWSYFTAAMLLMILLIYRKKSLKLVDMLTFIPSAVAGTIIMLMTFFSAHPSLNPNWVLLFLHPFHWVILFSFGSRKHRKWVFYYHSLNTLLLFMVVALWEVLPQVLNPAFLPWALTLALVSAGHIFKRYNKVMKSYE